MNYRIASILAAQTADTATTETLDINIAKPISRLIIEMKGTNNGSVPTAHPAKMVSKIEIVDGSNVITSLSGIQCQALNFYELGRLPTNIMEYRNDVMCVATYEINFGRWLWDALLAFDPSKFNNPQLKITHNKALGGSAPDAATLSVFAMVFDDKEITPTGFLMSKEQFNYTLVASAKERIDLATDFPYRHLMIQSLAAGKAPWVQYNQVKLTENNDAKVIINDEKTSDLLKILKDYPKLTESIMALDLDTSPTIYVTPTYDTSLVGIGMGSANATLNAAQSSGGSAVVTGDNAEHVQFFAHGMAPHGGLVLPLGLPDVPEDWYVVAEIGSLQLIITAGSGASGTCQIVSQQMRAY